MSEEILRVEDLSTDYSGKKNVNYITFSLKKGGIFGITALNGNGISSLSDALSGRAGYYSGRIYIDGEETLIGSVKAAERYGIYEIRETMALIPMMSVADNLNLRRSGVSFLGLYCPKEDLKTAEKILNYYGIDCDPYVDARMLSYLQKTEVLVCRALLNGAKIIIMREATAGFSNEELISFQKFLRHICEEGISVLLMNSDANTILKLADEFAVMRNGMLCWRRAKGEAQYYEVLRHMRTRHRSLTAATMDLSLKESEIVLRNCGTRGGNNERISLTLKGGRNTGLLWKFDGREDTVFNVFSGLIPAYGQVIENGKQHTLRNWLRKNRSSICCLRKNFWENELYESLSVGENISIRAYHRFAFNGFVVDKNIINMALTELCEKQDIDPDCLAYLPKDVESAMRNKIVLLRALFDPPKLLVMDNPFYAIDEETRYNLIRCVENLKRSNTAAFFCSGEEAVALDFCDDVVTGAM